MTQRTVVTAAAEVWCCVVIGLVITALRNEHRIAVKARQWQQEREFWNRIEDSLA